MQDIKDRLETIEHKLGNLSVNRHLQYVAEICTNDKIIYPMAGMEKVHTNAAR